MKALVIGGTGPTGPLVTKGLVERSYQVTVLHRGKHETELSEDVEHVHGDVDSVASIKEALGTRTFDIAIGMYGRLRYAAEVMKGKTDRFIAIGGAPYAAFVEGEKSGGRVPLFIRENAPLFRDENRNRFTYLMTVSEEVVMNAHRKGFYAGTILRFPMIYGPRQVSPREWSIIRRILDGRRRLVIPDGGLKLERRGYADNVAHAVLLAVDKPRESAGEIYNVGDEMILSLREWVDIIALDLNHEFELVSLPFSLARPSRPYAGRQFHWVTDIEKIKTKMEYRDQVPTAEGLRRTVRWYLENRPEPGGELEKNLGDPFDYETEDKIIKEYKKVETEIRRMISIPYQFQHAYGHLDSE